MESVSGENFGRLSVEETTIRMLQTQNQFLFDRFDDLENRSWRVNLCIKNIPEGIENSKNPIKDHVGEDAGNVSRAFCRST